jgi:hypothetical protein
MAGNRMVVHRINNKGSDMSEKKEIAEKFLKSSAKIVTEVCKVFEDKKISVADIPAALASLDEVNELLNLDYKGHDLTELTESEVATYVQVIKDNFDIKNDSLELDIETFIAALFGFIISVQRLTAISKNLIEQVKKV